MLSSSVIKNVGQASHYYNQQDNYYTREQGIEHHRHYAVFFPRSGVRSANAQIGRECARDTFAAGLLREGVQPDSRVADWWQVTSNTALQRTRLRAPLSFEPFGDGDEAHLGN